MHILLKYLIRELQHLKLQYAGTELHNRVVKVDKTMPSCLVSDQCSV